MMAAIAAGDVVQLKSGGPIMTVRWAEEDLGMMSAYCDWFVGPLQKGQKFAAVQLKKVGDDEAE